MNIAERDARVKAGADGWLAKAKAGLVGCRRRERKREAAVSDAVLLCHIQPTLTVLIHAPGRQPFTPDLQPSP